MVMENAADKKLLALFSIYHSRRCLQIVHKNYFMNSCNLASTSDVFSNGIPHGIFIVLLPKISGNLGCKMTFSFSLNAGSTQTADKWESLVTIPCCWLRRMQALKVFVMKIICIAYELRICSWQILSFGFSTKS